MTEERPKFPLGALIRVSGLFWPSIAAVLIAAMVYGYDCRGCGCQLVDSGVTEWRQMATLRRPFGR